MKTKKQTQAQMLGRKGERWFQNAIPKEWIFEKPADDFGVDARVYISDGELITGLSFSVQVKASRKFEVKDGHIVMRIDSASLGFWATILTPVLLVVYDDSLEAGFYSWVYDLLPYPPFAAILLLPQRETTTIRIPVENRIAPDCWSKLERDVERKTLELANALAGINLRATILSNRAYYVGSI
jgi:hypothetical protein